MKILTPFFKSPFTDFLLPAPNFQYSNTFCADVEMKALECLEAYGVDRGLRKCENLLSDFEECIHKTKQNNRIIAMRKERQRQFYDGERSKENRYTEHPPPADSF